MKTREEAIVMYKSEWWKNKTPKQICDIQMYEEKLCMPFDEFHKAVELALGRSVWTHEFADWDGMKVEYEGKREPEINPLKSADRILRKIGRPDLAENIIAVEIKSEAKHG